MNLTPQKIFEELRRTVVGQDEFLKTLSSAAWLHSMRYEYFKNTLEKTDGPRHLLVLGQSGTGKTLAVKKMAECLGFPVVIQDASALRGAGWKGDNVSNIIARIAGIAGNRTEAEFSIVCLDEIDKVFKSRVGESSFLPLDNLLTFLSGGIVTHSGHDQSVSLDTSQMLVICMGAFEGIEDIIKKRLSGEKSIGFSSMSRRQEVEPEDVLKYLSDEDLLSYGVPTEFLGRIAAVTRTNTLTLDGYKQILAESEASPIRQLDGLLRNTIKAGVSITDGAIESIARNAMEAKTGARVLHRMVMETLQPAIYELPGDNSISALILDACGGRLFVRYVRNGRPPIHDFGNENSIFHLSDIEKEVLHAVPFSCIPEYKHIIAYAMDIQEAYKNQRSLSQKQLSAAANILAAAICLWLNYMDKEKSTMFMVFREIELITPTYITAADNPLPHDETGVLGTSESLERLQIEFLEKADKLDPGLITAKKIAKVMLMDYCKSWLSEQESLLHTS